MQALVVGGTGPTGHFIVNGLLERGFDVAILHRGNHEIDEIPAEVEHIHTDPYQQLEVEAALGERRFDLCIVTYGRLRMLAEVFRNRCERFISAGGAPAYRGYMNPWLFEPAGIPVPIREDAEKVQQESDDSKGWRILRTEQALFELRPDATHFRYPYVYGPYQLVPREWLIVRRILDGRPHIILPDGGLTLHSFGYAENVAHALLLAVDRPERSRGQIYNVADEQVPSLHQVVEILCTALDHQMDIVNMPFELAPCTRPLVGRAPARGWGHRRAGSAGSFRLPGRGRVDSALEAAQRGTAQCPVCSGARGRDGLQWTRRTRTQSAGV